MIPNLTTRRLDAGRSGLPVFLALCLGLLFGARLGSAQHASGTAGGARGFPARSAPLLAQSSGPSLQSSTGLNTGNAAHNAPTSVRQRSTERSSSFNRHPSTSPSQPHMGLRLGLGGRWWDDHDTVRQLGLSSDQQHRMDNIFEANRPTLTNLYSSLQHEEANLASLSRADLHDEAQVFAAIDRVAHARNDLEKENVHVLLQIREQLAPQQIEALDRAIANAQ